MVHKPITANQMSIPDVIDESTRLHFGDYLCNATFQGLEDAWMKSNPVCTFPTKKKHLLLISASGMLQAVRIRVIMCTAEKKLPR